jgi:hypothetical protein
VLGLGFKGLGFGWHHYSTTKQHGEEEASHLFFTLFNINKVKLLLRPIVFLLLFIYSFDSLFLSLLPLLLHFFFASLLLFFIVPSLYCFFATSLFHCLFCCFLVAPLLSTTTCFENICQFALCFA